MLACEESSRKLNSVNMMGGEQVEQILGGANMTDSDKDQDSFQSCRYTNLFSSSSECRNYTGLDWTQNSAESDCIAQPDSSFLEEACDTSLSLGECIIDAGEPLEYRLVLSGSAPTDCQIAVEGCVIFARGQYEPSTQCEGQYEPVESILPNDVGTVFIPFEQICIDGEPNDQNSRCTWQAIGGCAPEGELFSDYAQCNPVLTQRPYAPVPGSGYETPQDDPLRQDENYLAEVEWVRSQAKSCGCVCCHEESKTPSGAAVWDTDKEGLWIDDWNPRGLAMGAGWLDSSTLGAFPANENNGFDRTTTVLPTTNVERMVQFFEGELARRGYTPEDFTNINPIGGPLYEQSLFEPSVCENGEGVTTDGKVSWVGGAARYIYVLEVGSNNPATPPNLDTPEGTLWRVDVHYQADGLTELNYGDTPERTMQKVPEMGSAPTLIEGQQYYLYVLKDIAIPITRCLFTYQAPQETNDSLTPPWGQACSQDSDCPEPTNFCVMAPGDAEGYCSVHCSSANSCVTDGAPEQWGCVAVSCDIEAFTWCGNPSEVEDSGGFLSLCP